MTEQQQPQTRKDIEARIIAKAWKDESYRQELLANPKAIFEQEFGIEFPTEINVEVLEETPTSLNFVLPMRPELLRQELNEEELELIAGGKLNFKKLASHVLGLSLVISFAGNFGLDMPEE